MKKIFAILAAALFVLSFAASAFAIHAEIPAETLSVVAKGTTQIMLGGEIRFRGWYYNNLGDPGATATGGIPESSNSKANYDGRVRLHVDAQVSPNVQGFVQLETGNIGGDTTDVYTWGSSFNYPRGGNKPSNLNILQAWIQYKGSGLFGFPVGLKVGHMPLRLGEGQFFDHTQFGDDAIVFFMDPTKQLHIGLLTIKFLEGASGDNTDDLDGYVALMTYKLNDKNTVGINYTFLNRPDGANLPGDAGLRENFKLHNVGLHANGSIGNFGYKAEADMQFGKNRSVTRDENDKYRGWAVMLGANYKMNPVNLRASFAYGSGDEDSDDDTNRNFQTFVGTIQHYTFVYDYRAATTAGFVGSGIQNTMYFNLGVDYNATKDLAFMLDGYLLRAAKAPHSVSKSAGWEIDGTMKYQIARNLSYAINAGYFKSGKFYDDTFENDRKAAAVVNNVLTLSF